MPLRKQALLLISFLVYSFHLSAQDVGCKVDGESVNNVLDSRFGQSAEYSQSVTLGVSFLLNNECDSALNYFVVANDISTNDALVRLIAQLGGTASSNSTPSFNTNSQQHEEPASTSEEVSVSVEEPVASPATEEPAAEEPAAADYSTLTFTAENLQEFQAKGLEKVRRLTEYLNILSQKTTPVSTALSTVESALSLFDSEDHTVEVSTLNRPEKSRFPVRTYLNRLRMLNYNRVVIQGASFTYVSTFRKGPDGNYYGVARFRQSFTGYRENRPIYSDITTKSVAVVLKPYQKAMEGEVVENWDVFLGDITVTHTEKQ